MSVFRNPETTRCCRAILIISLIVALFTNSATTRDKQRVLLISSYHPGFPTFFQQIEGIRSVFDPLPIDLDIEFMDSKRFYTPENLNNFYNSLHYKLSRTEDYDVIVAADDNALSFTLKHKQALFDKTPIVFFGVNSIKNAIEQNSNPNVTGIVEAVSMRETIELMIKLHPDIDKIVALVDGTPSGQGDLQTFYGLQPAFKSVVLTEISLARYTFEEFAGQLRKIDDKSAVLLLSAYRDKNNQQMAFHQSLKLIRSNLSRPVYHLWEHGMGDGLLGGKIISHYHQGKKAAELVTDIFGGKDPKDIPVVTESPNQYIFDYNELKRFNIKLSALPSEKTLINLPSTFYTRHKSVIWIGLGVVIGFSVIVVTLSINILRRKRAERDLRNAHDELDQKVKDRTVELREANKELQNEIQEREKAQEARHKSEEKYRSLVETTSDWIWEVDKNAVYTYSSPKVCDILGYQPEEIIGKTPYDFMPPEEAQRLGRLFKDIADAGAPFEGLEKSNIHKNGRHVVLETSGVPILDADGKLTGYRGVDRDITPRVQFEAQLRHQAQIIQQVHDSVISTDMEGVITSWNKGSERLFLYTADEALGSHVALVYPEEYHDMLLDDILPTLLSRGSHGYETTLIKKGGEEFTALVSLSLLTDENGGNIGMIGYTLDITDAKRLEQEREQLIIKLKEALNKVKTLSGLLPICASCKKIRDDKGYWYQIETYISSHSTAEFSHSICPECAKKLYPGINRHRDS